MVTLTEKQWEELREFGKKIPKPIPEKLDRTMTRKLVQDPYAIPLMFEAIRRDIKQNLTALDEMEEMLTRLKADDNTKHVFKLMIFFERKNQEEHVSEYNYIEAVALSQVELRKDVVKLLKSIEKTKKNNKLVTSLQNKMKKQEDELKLFRQTKPYIEFTKKFWDERYAEDTKN